MVVPGVCIGEANYLWIVKDHLDANEDIWRIPFRTRCCEIDIFFPESVVQVLMGLLMEFSQYPPAKEPATDIPEKCKVD
jgi:hypothetical protein